VPGSVFTCKYSGLRFKQKAHGDHGDHGHAEKQAIGHDSHTDNTAQH